MDPGVLEISGAPERLAIGRSKNCPTAMQVSWIDATSVIAAAAYGLCSAGLSAGVTQQSSERIFEVRRREEDEGSVFDKTN
jgi:hypothetical protein